MWRCHSVEALTAKRAVLFALEIGTCDLEIKGDFKLIAKALQKCCQYRIKGRFNLVRGAKYVGIDRY
jgi:hypothetical protein